MSLKTTFISQLTGEESVSGDLKSGSVTTALERKTTTLQDGAGLNQANRLFADSDSIAASSAATIDLFDFSGAKDAQGNNYALSKVKAIGIRNKATDSGAILRVGAEGTGATFNSVNGSDTVHIADVAPGGELILVAPSAAGYAVADSTNHLLKLANQSSSVALAYDIVVIGAQ